MFELTVILLEEREFEMNHGGEGGLMIANEEKEKFQSSGTHFSSIISFELFTVWISLIQLNIILQMMKRQIFTKIS